jgi:polyisoprenoid-binding protein YceI
MVHKIINYTTMKSLLLILSAFFCLTSYSQVYLSKSCEITFFSEAPLENIEAKNTAAVPVLSTSTNDLQVKIPIKGFKFKNALMEEHFNEEYLESDKFEHAIFKGKINEKIDYTINGKNEVSVTGKLEMHGVTREITIKGTLTVADGKILLDSKFNIHVADYKIEVPNMYVQNIAEDVAVTVKATLEPFKKATPSK